jgi:hypothetical protein
MPVAALQLILASFCFLLLTTFVVEFYISEKTWALIVLIYCLSASVIALVIAYPSTLRMRILSIAICYIGLTGFFASLHYLLFLRYPTAYVFADSIVAAQLRITLDGANAELLETREQLAVLNELLERADTAFEVLRGRTQPFTVSSGSLNLSEASYHMHPMGSRTFYTIEIRTPKKLHKISAERIGDPMTPTVKALFAAEDASTFKAAVERLKIVFLENQRRALATVAEKRPVWKYTEFLYFSAVTMTTAGFGDIVPTSRTSRILVAIQSMNGVLLVAFALAFFWPGE